MEDRSALFNQLKSFSQRKLKKVETKVVTASGEQLVEKRGAKGLQVLSGGTDAKDQQTEPARKLDLQVGLILPGLLIGSQDVAHDKSSVDSYGITHILNLDADVSNKFEDDCNYKNVNMQDKGDFVLDNILEDCFDFIDDGRHYGNVLVHCSGTIGLSRSTSICIAYLMSKEKQKFDEAFNNVKEARSFVKPNEGFMKQLRDYEVKLRGAQQVKDSGIDDPFALRKKQEIEQEKAMVAGAASVKNRMKMFGANLDAESATPRSKSVSPSPFKAPAPAPKQATKWAANQREPSKPVTPEPRRSWHQAEPDWRPSSAGTAAAQPPPPPPPPPPLVPAGGLHANDASVKPLLPASNTTPNNQPTPAAAANDMSRSDSASSSVKSSSSATNNPRYQQQPEAPQRMVFGRVPPPPMKIKGGLSIEKNDSLADTRNNNQTCNSASILLPNPRMASFGSAHDPFDGQRQIPSGRHQLNQRCESPLILLNNTSDAPQKPASPSISQRPPARPRLGDDESGVFEELAENPFKFWRNTMSNQQQQQQAPKRTVSLGPKRPSPTLRQPPGGELQNNPFVRGQVAGGDFNKAVTDLQSSLTELNKLIDAPPAPARVRNKSPRIAHSYIMTLERAGDEENQAPIQACSQFESEDPLNRRASTSINDLRSVFESKMAELSKQNYLQTGSNNLATPSHQKPPRSASPSVLKNSPWHDLSANQKPPGGTQVSWRPPVQSAGSDYTIRRTTSTNSRSSAREIRNPYRSYY